MMRRLFRFPWRTARDIRVDEIRGRVIRPTLQEWLGHRRSPSSFPALGRFLFLVVSSYLTIILGPFRPFPRSFVPAQAGTNGDGVRLIF